MKQLKIILTDEEHKQLLKDKEAKEKVYKTKLTWKTFIIGRFN